MSFDRKAQIDIVRSGAITALRIEGLKIVFDVQKDAKTFANIGRIQVYNLSKETRHGRFQEMKDQIILRAGYADESMDEIFHGDLVTVSHPKTGPDIITTIEANDGQAALRMGFTSRSYGQNTSVKQVIGDVAKDLGIPIKTLDWAKLITDQRFLQGFAAHGRAADALDKVCARAGLEWSIQGNQLQILKYGGVIPIDLAQIPVVSPGHGLIGSPERLQRLQGDSPDKKPAGWKIKSNLIGRLEPGGQIGLLSDDVPKPTAFRIQSVHHQGDTHGEDWSSTVEALDPGVLISGAG